MQRNLNQSPATGTETAAQATSFRQNAEGFAKIKDIIFLMLGHWKWFVLSLAVAFGAAYYYLQITPKSTQPLPPYSSKAMKRTPDRKICCSTSESKPRK